jgi:signal transduction histidine kinase/ligand-binding sensor domain-containing protein
MNFAALKTGACRLLAGLGLLLALRAAGAGSDYLLDVWTSESGLPDSSVTSIVQTPDGYLWIGTYNGMARFDGVHFVTFDPVNTPQLGHARVRKMFVDANGALWIVANDGSVTRMQDGKFFPEQHNLRFSEGELTLVASSPKENVFLTGRGDLFRKPVDSPPGKGWTDVAPPERASGLGAMACQDNKGVIWYRDGDKKLWRLVNEHYELVPDAAGLAGQNVNYLTTDARGRVWVGTDRGIFTWRQNEFHQVMSTEPNGGGVTFLAVTEDSRIWVVANGMVGMVQDGRWVIPLAAERNLFSGTTSRIGAESDGQGGMWFYNYGRGLLHVDAAGKVLELKADDGFPGERVYCFFPDREGNWWAGLDTGGLVRVRERQFHIVTDGDKALTKPAKSVSEDSLGTIWIGMLGGGLGRWQPDNFTNLPVTDGVGGGSVFCVCPDDEGRLWLSAGDEDLFIRAAGETSRVSPVIHGVKVLLRDHAGRIWAGTTTGLLCADSGEPDELQPFREIPRRNIRALSEDAAGTLWAGTGNGELYQISSNRVTLFRTDNKSEPDAIWSVLADEGGVVWLGTFRGGLLRFCNGKFTRYGKQDGLPDNVICQILDDGEGNLWFGSHQGIFRAPKSALNDFAAGKTKFIPCVTYGRSDGLPSLETSGGYQPSAWRDHAGRLWFVTAKGATWIQPEKVRANSKPPPVVIEDVTVDGVSFSMDAASVAAKEAPLVEVPPGRHQIEFHYTGLSLGAAERVQFRYQLSNVDNDWVLAGTRRSVQYNLLPPGDYQFRVRACNSDGVWSDAPAGLHLRVLPHFYETWWFRLLAVVVILGTVAIVVKRLATRRLRRKMEQLERKQMVERERARIAKDIHDDLGANLTLIAVLGDLAKKEKTEERIEKMSGTARDAVKSLDEIVWAVNPRNDTLAHLIDYMGQFATDYLRDAGVRCLLDVPDHPPAREVPANVRHNIFLVVKEAMQNIVKHAHATEVWLRVSAGESSLHIAVEDNGCGFARAPQDAWADGLRNMRQRLAEIGGECRIESDLGKGTTISVELPLRAD